MHHLLSHMIAGPLLVLLAGCGTVFDFAPPPAPILKDSFGNTTDSVTTFQLATEGARYYRRAYYERVAGQANAFQFFEVPEIDSAVIAVTALAFKAGRDIALGAGLAGGALAVLENFYAPRERTEVYLAGHNAMSCIQRLALRGMTLYEQSDVSVLALQSIRETLVTETDVTKRAALQKAITVSAEGPSELDDALTTVNTVITKQAISKSVRPDISKIATDLRKSASQATQNTTARSLVTARDLQGRGRALPDARVQQRINELLDYSAEFDHNLTACKAIAG